MADDQVPQTFFFHQAYLKDVSFESPNVPVALPADFLPDADINILARGERQKNQYYEVVLTVTVTVRDDDGNTLYLVEIIQAGVFAIEGFAPKELNEMIGVRCPEMLFPFAREELAALVSKGGFPQLLIPPVNFNELYMKRKQGSTPGSVASRV